ncbi:MAG: hypothetical protein AB1597_00035 [Chloroflexota bacterium]
MNWYRVRFTVKGATLTAWKADTIFGHFCWYLSRTRGEDRLRELLDACVSGQPPVMVSNGLPCDLLPRPIMPRPPRDVRKPIDKQKEDFDQLKKNSDIQFVSIGDFAEITTGKVVIPKKADTFWSGQVTLKNQINRLTGTTGEDASLFSVEERFTPSVTVYIKATNDWENDVRAFFTVYLTGNGYGKRKTAGYGWVAEATLEPFPGFAVPAGANGFISLSDFVPAANDPVRGWWRVLVKYGKLGEEYALGGNPFKKPLVMLEAGACFYDSPVREFYGRAVRGLASGHPEVVQYGFALPVPVVLPAPD